MREQRQVAEPRQRKTSAVYKLDESGSLDTQSTGQRLEGGPMKRFLALLLLSTLTLLGQQGTRKFVPVTDAMLQKPDPANWMSWRRTLDGWGYSPLNQINRNNVAQMRIAWTRPMGAGNTQESTPLVYDGVMYLPNSGDLIEALDARSGDLIWDYQRPL